MKIEYNILKTRVQNLQLKKCWFVTESFFEFFQKE